MKLEIKKLEKKIKLDTTIEGCLKDCMVPTYAGYTKDTTMAGVGNCLQIKYTAKGNWFF